MKNGRKIVRQWLFLVAGLGLGVLLPFLMAQLPALVSAQGSSQVDETFTFHGRLRLSDRTTRITETCDFRFEIYDTETPGSGTVVGTPALITQTLTVTRGYFSVDLNFGPVFNGDTRYLDIAVKCPADTDFVTMDQRFPLLAAPYTASVPWAGVANKPAFFEYVAGFGLDLSNFVFSVNTDEIQTRVTGVCADNQKMLGVTTGGTVTCLKDADTTYSPGTGLKFKPTPDTTTLHIDPVQVQRRSNLSCPTSFVLQKIDQAGNGTCVPYVSGATVGDGLTRTDLGNNRVEIKVGNSDITTPLLADNSVTSAKIADSQVKSSDIGSGQVTTVEIANDSILLEDFNKDVANCAQEDLLRYNTTNPAGWKCGDSLLFTAGDGLQVDSSDTLKIDAAALAGVGIEAVNNDLTVQFAGNGSADSAARSNHTHPYKMTIGGGNGTVDLNNGDTVPVYFTPTGSSFNFTESQSCLVIAAGYLFNPNGGYASKKEAFLKTGKSGSGDTADAMAFGATGGPFVDDTVPVVAASHVWSGVTGSGDFGCYIEFPGNNSGANNDERLACRVSFACVPE